MTNYKNKTEKNDSVRQKLHITKAQRQKPIIRKMESRNKKKNASTHNELLAQRLSEKKQITELRKKKRNASIEIELLEQRQSERKRLEELKKQKKNYSTKIKLLEQRHSETKRGLVILDF